MLTAVALLIATPAGDAEPPPVPSGMDLLYSDRVAFLPTGEPIVTLGLMDGQDHIQMRANSAMHIDFWEHGVLKRTTVSAGTPVVVTVRRAQAAQRLHYLDLEGVDWDQPDRVEWAQSGWQARGYARAKVLEEGTVLGIGGRVLDNREYRVILPVASRTDGLAVKQEVYDRFGQRAFLKSRISERPWGELLVEVGGAPLGLATSFVRFNTVDGTPVGVAAVEYGKGYRWHGRENRSYRGELYAVVDPAGKLAAVNVVGVEKMLAGVVPSEIFASAHPEALRAQAVAARNTLLAKLGRRHHGDPFHLCSDQHCQVYSGVNREHPSTSAAIAATYGQALFYQERLVDAVYSSTCGGHTEDNDAVWGDRPNPALRAVPDFDVTRAGPLASFADGIDEDEMFGWVEARPITYCSRATGARANKFRWERKLTGADANRLVSKRYPKLGPLRNITIEERGRGGRVISLRLVGETGQALVVHELPIRRLFDNLNSGTFILETKRTAAGALAEVTFVGGGWGHGVGMCQLGAIGRAEANHDHGRILSHYYNGAKIQQLYRPARAQR